MKEPEYLPETAAQSSKDAAEMPGLASRLCQIGTARKGMPCLANINVLSGLDEPCEICAINVQKMRETMGWVPFRDRFYMSNKLADFQHDALLDRINAATTLCELREGIGLCDQCTLPKWPQRYVGYGHMVCLDCLAKLGVKNDE